MGRVRARIIVEGRVQGVGFRLHTQDRARALGLAGFVQNQWDGKVLVEAEGEPAKVRQFISWLHRGPSLAYVSQVRVTWVVPDPPYATFEVRY